MHAFCKKPDKQYKKIHSEKYVSCCPPLPLLPYKPG